MYSNFVLCVPGFIDGSRVVSALLSARIAQGSLMVGFLAVAFVSSPSSTGYFRQGPEC